MNRGLGPATHYYTENVCKLYAQFFESLPNIPIIGYSWAQSSSCTGWNRANIEPFETRTDSFLVAVLR